MGEAQALKQAWVFTESDQAAPPDDAMAERMRQLGYASED